MLVRPGVFDPPDRLAFPPPWIGHIPFAFWLVDILRPATFVELGTHSGNSYSAFCQAIQRLGISCSAFAVDTWAGDEHSGHYGEEVFAEFSHYHDSRFAGFSRLVRSTFDDAVGHFADSSIELLHIDGLHTYHAVKHDFETWLPKMSPRGVVVFHDTNVREHEFGVWKYWEELAAKYPHIRFDHCNGLGALGVGSVLPDELQRLFENRDEPGELALVRQFFSALGSLHLLTYATQAETTSADHSKGRTAIAQHVESIRASLGKEVAAVHKSLQELREDLALKRENTQLRSELEDVRTESRRLQTEVVRLGTEVSQRGRENSHLRNQFDMVQGRLDTALAQIAELYRSRSWRVTLPLRKLSSMFTRDRQPGKRGPQ